MPQTYLLRGKIVTMNDQQEVFENGLLLIKDDVIQCVYPHGHLPPDVQHLDIIESGGVIYPGLIDLHNHYAYNSLPLWVVPQKYTDRNVWRRNSEYSAAIQQPLSNVLAVHSQSAKAIVRLVEAKAIVGGITTGQGMKTKLKGGEKLYNGAMRNVEVPGVGYLPKAQTNIMDFRADKIEEFRATINKPELKAYFLHLSEGTDANSRQHFLDLKINDLINEKLVGIHALALNKDDLQYMADRGAKIVWSPFSNQLLYGQTLELSMIKSAGIQFSIGCDWTPSGSKNLLQELKVAAFTNEEQGSVFSDFELVRAITRSPSEILAWDKYVGTLQSNKLADLIVIDDLLNDPYQNLIRAREQNVRLVMIGGVPRAGNESIMDQLVHDTQNEMESILIGGVPKKLYLFSLGSELNGLTLNKAMSDLTEIMSDLKAFEERAGTEKLMFIDTDGNAEDFELVPDEDDVPLDEKISDFATVFEDIKLYDIPMQNKIDLDRLYVEGDDYWNRISAQQNISDKLKTWLKQCYGVN